MTVWKDKWIFRAQAGDNKACVMFVCTGMSGLFASFSAKTLPWRTDLGWIYLHSTFWEPIFSKE
jgi:hypothetical protein